MQLCVLSELLQHFLRDHVHRKIGHHLFARRRAPRSRPHVIKNPRQQNTVEVVNELLKQIRCAFRVLFDSGTRLRRRPRRHGRRQ
ncbi:hypothetical protein ACFX2J_042534 [Malus domestica]